MPTPLTMTIVSPKATLSGPKYVPLVFVLETGIAAIRAEIAPPTLLSVS